MGMVCVIWQVMFGNGLGIGTTLICQTKHVPETERAIARSNKVLKGGAFDSLLPDIYPHRRIHLAHWAKMGEVRFVITSLP